MQNNEQRKIDKMLPWINKARQNSTQNLNLLHELRKVTILSTKEEKFEVTKGDGGPSDEFLEERHARFVIPDEAASKKEVQGSIVHGLNERKKSSVTETLTISPDDKIEAPINHDQTLFSNKRQSEAIQEERSIESLEYAI